MTYWLAVMSHAVWQDFENTGYKVLGFSRGLRRRHKRPRRRDVILCCLIPERRCLAVVGVDGTVEPSARFYRAKLPVLYRVKPTFVVDGRRALVIDRPRDYVVSSAALAVARSPYPFRDVDMARSIVDATEERASKKGTAKPSSSLQIPEGLLEACRAGECIAVVGSGLAAPAGTPMWGEFVPRLRDWAIRHNYFDAEYAEALREAAEQGNFNDVADTIVDRVSDPKALAGFLRSIFERKGGTVPETYRLLRDLPLAAVLTTNFDNFLERAYGAKAPVYTPLDAEELSGTQSRRDFYLLKLYGTLRRPESVLVAPAQYEAAVSSNLPFSDYMQGLFVSRTLLFLGASLEGISAYLGGLNFRGGNPGTRDHYALVNVEGTAWRPKADLLLRRYGIHVLPYSPSADFKEVPAFLRALRDLVLPSNAKKEKQGVAPVVTSSRLRRLILENIGPFDRLELDLDAHWNVIVGDNGVGKSAILRAIAVAIIGEDSASFAHRLVKAKRRSAMIRLETDQGKTYVTKLLLKDAGVVISSHPTRPLEAENWLALGFPALRTITWQRPKEFTSEGKPRIHPQDLLPLISGDPDPRMDGLKQWLVNLDYEISRVEKKSDARILREQQKEFCTIVTRLLPGSMARLEKIDFRTKEVLVKTPDGILPIEAISQGATSFLGWLGVVLQRLYDIYAPATGSIGKPLDQYALVLIDEIDAHMHPAWQRTVVKDVQRACPNAQFIATTHSPLIVSNLTPAQVCALHRGLPPLRPEESLEGYRADQILTLPIFNLETTLSVAGEKNLADYRKLLAKTHRSVKEEEDMRHLAERIGLQWPSHPESAEGRHAVRKIEEASMSAIKALPKARREQLITEAQRALADAH